MEVVRFGKLLEEKKRERKTRETNDASSKVGMHACTHALRKRTKRLVSFSSVITKTRQGDR